LARVKSPSSHLLLILVLREPIETFTSHMEDFRKLQKVLEVYASF